MSINKLVSLIIETNNFETYIPSETTWISFWENPEVFESLMIVKTYEKVIQTNCFIFKQHLLSKNYNIIISIIEILHLILKNDANKFPTDRLVKILKYCLMFGTKNDWDKIIQTIDWKLLIIKSNTNELAFKFLRDIYKYIREFATINKIYAKKLKYINKLCMKYFHKSMSLLRQNILKILQNDIYIAKVNHTKIIGLNRLEIDLYNKNLSSFKALSNIIKLQRQQHTVCCNDKCHTRYIINFNQKWKICNGCGAMTYCKRKCQKIHWKDSHKKQCPILQNILS